MTHSGCSTSTEVFEPSAENHPARIGPITLDVKHTGKPSAGNLHAGFEVAGAGNQLYGAMAPVLDPTN
jgi:hypothetical protein